MDDRFLHIFCIICWTDYKDCKKSLIISETMTQTNVGLFKSSPEKYTTLLFIVCDP